MANVSVTIKDMAYSPDPVQVNQGDTVTWTNEDSMQHTATSNAGPSGNPPAGGIFNTGASGKGQASAAVAFNQAPGNIGYFCTFHTFMTGTVQVMAASEAAKQKGAESSGTR